MARGFWTGVVHGGLLSAAALAGLSLLAPAPWRNQTAPAPEAQSEAAPAIAATPEPAVTPPADQAVPPDQSSSAETMPAETSDAPLAAAVDLPVGSEFGRGGDVAPRLPAPLAVPASRMDQTEAPAVSAPAAEPAPVAITGPVERPEARMPGGNLTPTPMPEGEAAPDFARPSVLDAPSLVTAPDMAGASDPDQIPEARPVAADQPGIAPEPAPEIGPETDSAAAPEPATQVPAAGSAPVPVTATPARPSSAPDLSTPPDLSELRGLNRSQP